MEDSTGEDDEDDEARGDLGEMGAEVTTAVENRWADL